MTSKQSTTNTAPGCANPIRLTGFHQRIDGNTGEVLSTLGTPEHGGGILIVACKDRRASCCPACARLYERDAYQLIASGLRGGKGIPESVRQHPAVMVTLTAPSFGAVHSNRRAGKPCRCGRLHTAEDPRLGTALNPARYRYAEQAVWNRYASQLWKHTIQAVRRGLATTLGVKRSELSQIARIRFVKVAEFQRRGVVHYHAILRIDGPNGPDDPPPATCTAKLLRNLTETSADTAAITIPDALREAVPDLPAQLRWGTQHEIVEIDANTSGSTAGYIAKYTTKATETVTAGTLVKPIRTAIGLKRLTVPDHPKAIITAAWTIGQQTGDDTFKRWAHQFGYGGHAITKSHGYSVTFGALRATRAHWHHQPGHDDPVIVRTNLSYTGRGRTPKSGQP